MWEPEAGHEKIDSDRPRQSHLNTVLRDDGINSKEELLALVRDRDVWRGISSVDQT
jgi:hypothetical protein